MPICQAFKADHQRCSRNATRNGGEDIHPEHLHLCGQHKRTYHDNFFTQALNTHHTEGRCFHLTRVIIAGDRIWQWCPFNAAAGQMLCEVHERSRQEKLAVRLERDNAHDVVRELVDNLLAEDPPVPWRRAVRVLAEMGDITLANRHQAAMDYYGRERLRHAHVNEPIWFFNVYWNWAAGGRIGPEPVFQAAPPVAQAGLAAIARDAQNVHTQVVTEQTNKATEKLLAVKVPETQQTEKTLAQIWLDGVGGKISFVQFLRVTTDINRWFNTRECRAANDDLYRKLLRGLVALISSEKDDERKAEMYRRLWEECSEAVGMCCEGHIGRLCNVLVGFDEAFQPPVPFGEILQNKMSAIAAMDVSEEEKRTLANAFFDEHKVPETDRVAWLDAF